MTLGEVPKGMTTISDVCYFWGYMVSMKETMGHYPRNKMKNWKLEKQIMSMLQAFLTKYGCIKVVLSDDH